MKTQDLITRLESLKRVHGNLPIAVRDPNDEDKQYIRIASSLSIEDGISGIVIVIL